MNEKQKMRQFNKNASNTEMVKFARFKEKRLIDIRVYYAAENGGLKLKPKGILISRDFIPELKLAVDKAAEEWERELPGAPGDSEPVRGDG